MLLFSPWGRINQVPVQLIFDALRYLMFRWGFIGVFRADNGAPFGEPTRQSLSVLNLCLCALGIRVKLNPPCSPQKNAKVERNQGTTARWADPAQCKNYLELQQRLNQVVEDQREHFHTRVCKNKTRAECFPQLFQNPKRLHVEGLNMQFVFDLLAKGSWQRKVSREGATDMFGKTYQVGYQYRSKTVSVTFDPINIAWVFKNERGVVLNTKTATNLKEQNIRDLSLSQ
jgi:hypothetical protein